MGNSCNDETTSKWITITMEYTSIQIESNYPSMIQKLIYEIIYQHIIREGKIVKDKIREELGL